MNPATLRDQARSLGPWFHNLSLHGVPTAPDHALGDYPACVWQYFAHALPEDLTGRSVLDIGCNAGFFSIEMKRRGASRVLGIDADPRYLAQARFAAGVLDLDVEYREMSVYDVGSLGERFDIVLFMGVLYHLRHPLLALDLLREHVVQELLVFQSMQRGSREIHPAREDYPFDAEDPFSEQGWPRLNFIEHRYAGDPTNYWIPNRAGVEALLRNAGFEILQQPDREVYLCRPTALPYGSAAVYPAKGPR
ncbi:TIGR04290 family methyltransferase [Pseudoroseomonas globiformis]|uniref:TIGR04290 family methyltransferase n=1 Tax=Teichococcus globiformis TaxID=2307229 RepID=A0ABV7G3X1_9PROT